MEKKKIPFRSAEGQREALTKEIKHCEVCFNTRLEPEILEAITALDLADKFKESEKCRLANISRDISSGVSGFPRSPQIEDNYMNPPEGSYFHYVIQKKEKLEKLYSQFIVSGASTDREKEFFKMLAGELIGYPAPVERKQA